MEGAAFVIGVVKFGADAARFLRTMDTGFTRMRNRLRQLGKCFENGEAVPKQRGPYKKRVKSRINSLHSCCMIGENDH